ncbi:probable tRNA pseudouridine synthase 1 isoform X1 [Daphnia magna]|uniref:probable tRNA pseudouridine synthase 1 isoform X1 n=1 Tax=Daphnia magna TaxID=35525 RepID=UPI001E1BC4A3|nr:probable tRNA pseudouridine synthase 1 isoform X1 [Daphnia magna]
MSITRLQGIFPVFKPRGITSSQLLEVIKIKLNKENTSDTPVKMGHGGTLDINATGVLVVGINDGCSKLPAFLGGSKVYHSSCVFGRATDSYNKEGKTIMEKSFDHITLSDINSFSTAMKGQVLQKPPPFSALKFQGKRLSDLAREGTVVDPNPRLVNCYDFKVIEFVLPKLTFELSCSKGFYVRSLVHDLGLALDSCAYLDELERIRQGPFETDHCLMEEDCTVSGIKQKILDMWQSTEEYLDCQMTMYRSLNASKNQSQFPVKHKHGGSNKIGKKQSHKWEFVK